MTKTEFRNALKGRQILVNVQGAEFEVRISQREALALYDYCDGDIAYIKGSFFKTISLMANASELYGETGDLNQSE